MIEVKNLLTGEIIQVRLSEFITALKNVLINTQEATPTNPAGTPKYAIAQKGTTKAGAQIATAQTSTQTVNLTTNSIAKTTKKKGCGCK